MANTQQIAVKTLGGGLFTAIAPAVQSCDDRLTRLEQSQNILMERLTTLESKLGSVREAHTVQKSALPLLKKRTAQLEHIRKRMNKLHSTMNTMAQRVQRTEVKLLALPQKTTATPATLPPVQQHETKEETKDKKEEEPATDEV